MQTRGVSGIARLRKPHELASYTYGQVRVKVQDLACGDEFRS